MGPRYFFWIKGFDALSCGDIKELKISKLLNSAIKTHNLNITILSIKTKTNKGNFAKLNYYLNPFVY